MAGSLLLIGVGFMGGSLTLALRKRGFEGKILGVDLREEAIAKGLERGAIDRGWTSLEGVEDWDVDMVVLATPVGTFRGIGEELKGFVKRGTVITDLGSVKGRLVDDLERVLGRTFVGGHPIAGTEKSGVQNSNPDLFEGKKVILTPTERTDRDAVEMVREMWEKTGAVVEFMDAHLHDWVFGAVSHLPHAVAFALIDAIIDMSRDFDLFKYPGAGFKDFTRIAASDPTMWRDIFIENRENTLKAIDVYISSLKKLRGLIEEEKIDDLTAFLEEVKDRRMNLE